MENWSLLFISVPLGLLWIGLGIPHLLEKIPPNDFMGFRTPKTFSNKDIWYKANKKMGKELILAGIVTIIISTAWILIPNNVSMEFNATVLLVIITVTTAIAAIKSFLYLRKL